MKIQALMEFSVFLFVTCDEEEPTIRMSERSVYREKVLIERHIFT